MSSLAFIVESIDANDGCTLMVATVNDEIFRVLDLLGKHQTSALQTCLPRSTQSRRKRWLASGGKPQAQQVVILPVDVANDFDGRFEF
jgi:hypothetical protein